ncbi:hypothetical protein [Kitasatospora sp. NBC_01266]|uniref:hypothetical protein n=1 Tax=Kitasatospora sp. NBC_01266 TaxID=2903572 RepID=UPI002E3002D7|nr:hypothetical protein [Kitasatospora sp. NBC_01266]
MSLLYFIGQDVQLTAAPLTDAGQPATGTLAVQVTVTDPTGTVTTPVVTGSAGAYAALVPTVAVAGVWLVRWTATGTSTAWATEDQFTVRPTGIEQLVDLAGVKAHLNIPAANTSADAELQGFILAAADLARDRVGPILPEQHTEWHDGGTQTITLDWQPVVSIQSVTEYVSASTWNLTYQPLGTSTDAYGYTYDLDTGQITRRATGGAVRFPGGIKNVRVVYTAGRAGVSPGALRLGALELIRHLWSMTQQGGGRPRIGGGMLDADGGNLVPQGFALPSRVLELWKPEARGPGIA